MKESEPPKRLARLALILTTIILISILPVNAIGHWAYPSKGNLPYHQYYVEFENYCPLCHHTGTLIWNPKGTYEGEWTCVACDADYCAVTGADKANSIRAYLIHKKIKKQKSVKKVVKKTGKIDPVTKFKIEYIDWIDNSGRILTIK